MDIDDFQWRLAEFAKDRDWEQFHTPKNLAMALTGEAGELLEVFQWLTAEQSLKENISESDLEKCREEIADVLLYVLRLADTLDIDLEEAARAKLERNAKKYPVELSKGNATKYNQR